MSLFKSFDSRYKNPHTIKKIYVVHGVTSLRVQDGNAPRHKFSGFVNATFEDMNNSNLKLSFTGIWLPCTCEESHEILTTIRPIDVQVFVEYDHMVEAVSDWKERE